MTHTPHSMLTPGRARRPFYNWPIRGSGFALIKDVEEALTLDIFPDEGPDAFVYDRFGNVRRAGAWTEEDSR